MEKNALISPKIELRPSSPAKSPAADMEDDPGWAFSSAVIALPAAPAPRAPPSKPPKEAPPPPAAASAAAKAASLAAMPRRTFAVELMPGETTTVSWKKLLKESGYAAGDLTGAAGPSAAVQPAEGEPNDALPPNRFSAVIEKIESLYMGKQSSDEEELDNDPDDDQYDTEDSFIDDVELDEYFQVDKLETKHSGYFVNRGKLEEIERRSSPNEAPKKRRRKHSTKSLTNKDQEQTRELVNMGNMRIKAAARSAPLTGKKSSTPKILINSGEHYEDGKHLQSKSNAPAGTYKKKPADCTINSENASAVKISNKDAVSLPLESNELDKHKPGAILSRDRAHKSKEHRESFDGMHLASQDKDISSQIETQPKILSNGNNGMELSTEISRKEMNGVSELPDLNSSGNVCPMQTAQPLSARVKKDSIVRPKGTTLERAIRDLEKIVAESRPAIHNEQEGDTSSQAVKRRLPQDIKQKLAKVVRLSVSHGRISEDQLMDRLMGILGHVMQRKTLKRHMKEMGELGSSAKQQNTDRVQQLKNEVHEMLRTHPLLTSSMVSGKQDGSAEDFQEVGSNDETRALKQKHIMGKTLEDKICDLYDLYVEGIDEDNGPQSRKFYVQQLAELCCIDNLAIKYAIHRSKERKRALYRRHNDKVCHEERIKRKRLKSSIKVEETTLDAQIPAAQEKPATYSASQVHVSPEKMIKRKRLKSSIKVEETALDAQPQAAQEKPATYSASQVHVSPEKMIKRKRLKSSIKVEETALDAQPQAAEEKPATNSASLVHASPDKIIYNHAPASSGISDPAPLSDSGTDHSLKLNDNIRDSGSVSTTLEGGNKIVAADVKKKMKRKSNPNVEQFSCLPPNPLPVQQMEESPNYHKKGDEPNATPLPSESSSQLFQSQPCQSDEKYSLI